MTKQEAAIVSAYTGFLIGSAADLQSYIEKLLDRPVWTHELANQKLVDEIHERSKADFVAIKID